MKLFKRLLSDEYGMVMSAEMVMLGTVGVLALTAGIGVMTTAVNDELVEMGQAFRSFNQNFEVVGYQSSYSGGSGGRRGNSSMMTGSSFVQRASSEDAADKVFRDYQWSRNRQLDMHRRAQDATIRAQRSFVESAEGAADVQKAHTEWLREQAKTRRAKEAAKATEDQER
jgi:hypothetical protein